MSFKLSKKNFILIISISLIGVGVTSYLFYSLKTPQRIIRNSFFKTEQIKSFGYKAILSVKSDLPSRVVNDPSDLNKKVNFTIRSEGNIDKRKIRESRISSHFGIDINVASSSINLAKGELLGVNNIFYLRLDKLLEFGIFNLKRIENKWYRVSLADFLKNDKLKKDYGKTLNEFENNVNERQMIELGILARKTDFLTVTGVMPEEIVNGRRAYHYKYRINTLGLEKFLDGAKEILSGTKFNSKESLDLDRSLTKLSGIGGDIWIGKQDNLIYGITVVFEDTLEKGISARISFASSLFNFNKPVKISIPNETESIDSINNIISSSSSSSLPFSSSATTPTSSASEGGIK